MTPSSILAALGASLASGAITVVDLTAPLGPSTPVIRLPPEVGKNTPPVTVHRISRYDEDGPLSAWNWIELGEHTGTHFDAPIHWISGRDHADGATDTIPVGNFVAPLVVIDCSREAAADPDYLLTVDSIRAWESQHGPIEPGCWVLMRTDWSKRNGSSEAFLNVDETGPHWPGPTADAIRYLVSRGAVGWGCETIGTDAGLAASLTPSFPAHHLMHEANRYGLASLANLDRLPPRGAIMIAAPLKFVDGTGSPVRALALMAA